MILVGLLARACISDGDSGGSIDSQGSVGSGATPSSVTCWNGTSAVSVADCAAPTGLDELVWMFPSISDACPTRGPAPSGRRQVVICPFETSIDTGYIRYSNWDNHDDAINHYTSDFGAEPAAWTLNGEDVGSFWQEDQPRTGRNYEYKAAAVYRDLPLSFSAYAHTREGLQSAIDEVVSARPPDELRGVRDTR